MFRLIRTVVVLSLGFFAGVKYEQANTRAECKAGEGEWTGTICIGSELLQ
ncbi:MAG: hypothetical protein WBC93_18945 [Sulfitobacter sp.]